MPSRCGCEEYCCGCEQYCWPHRLALLCTVLSLCCFHSCHSFLKAGHRTHERHRNLARRNALEREHGHGMLQYSPQWGEWWPWYVATTHPTGVSGTNIPWPQKKKKQKCNDIALLLATGSSMFRHCTVCCYTLPNQCRGFFHVPALYCLLLHSPQAVQCFFCGSGESSSMC